MLLLSGVLGVEDRRRPLGPRLLGVIWVPCLPAVPWSTVLSAALGSQAHKVSAGFSASFMQDDRVRCRGAAMAPVRATGQGVLTCQ